MTREEALIEFIKSDEFTITISHDLHNCAADYNELIRELTPIVFNAGFEAGIEYWSNT